MGPRGVLGRYLGLALGRRSLQPPPGALYAGRVPLPEPGGFRVSIDGVPIEGLTADADALEARSVERPR